MFTCAKKFIRHLIYFFPASIFLFTALPALAENLVYAAPPQPIPPFVFQDESGNDRAVADYRGKVVLLNFWASWCPVCLKELHALDALQRAANPKKLVILAVAQDRDASSVSAFYRSHGIENLPIAVDPARRVGRAFRLRGLPTTLVINPEGLEIARIVGSIEWSPDETASLFGLDRSHFIPISDQSKSMGTQSK